MAVARSFPFSALLIVLVLPGICHSDGKRLSRTGIHHSEGDSTLEQGVLARLADDHFRHRGGHVLYFIGARDNKHLLTISGFDGIMTTWDLATGWSLAKYTLPTNVDMFALSQDGKRLAVGVSDGMLDVWSLQDGKRIANITDSGAWRMAFSVDGATVFVLNTKGVLRTIDVATKKVLRRTVLEKLPKNLRDDDGGEAESSANFVVSRDGKTVAGYVGKGSIRLWDGVTGKELCKLDEVSSKSQLVPRPLTFSRDGKLLASAGSPTTVSLWDVAKGRKLRSFRVTAETLEDEEGVVVQNSLLAFSPDGKFLATDADAIQLWDTETGAKTKVFPFLCDYIRCLSFSEDGKNLLAMGDGDVMVWDIAAGRLLGHPDGSIERFGTPCYLPDGRRFYTTCSRIESASTRQPMPRVVHETVVWDIASGKRLHAVPGQAVTHSPDGKYLITGGADGSDWMSNGMDPIYFMKPDSVSAMHLFLHGSSPDPMYLVSAETGKVIRRLPGGQGAFSPSGHQLAIFSNGTIQTFDCVSGKILHEWTFGKTLTALWASADLSRFLAQDRDTAYLLDITRRKEIWRRKSPCTGFTSSDRKIDLEYQIPGRVSADERSCTVVSPSKIEAWDMRTGEEIWTRLMPEKLQEFFLGEFSSDGKYFCGKSPENVVVVSLDARRDQQLIPRRDNANLLSVGGFLRPNLLRVTEGDQVGLWRPNGKLVRKFDFRGHPADLVASADGKLIAGRREDGNLFVLEIATGQTLQTFKSRESATYLFYAPDGKTLLTHDEQRVVVWDLTGLKLPTMPGPLPLPASEFEGCWEALSKPDGKRFHSAFWKMVADPQQTVARLVGLLQPARARTAKTVEQLICDLGDSSFRTREQANLLLASDESAIPVLRERLKQEISLEEKRRIEQILYHHFDLTENPPILREYRAIQVLEQIGSREAIDLLRRLSGGAPGALTTQEARASLTRLSIRR